MPSTDEAGAVFAPLRPRLLRVAYRMLGSLADAEDVVQDAFIRWHTADRAAVRQPEGFLTRIVTRLCLDQLKSARRRRVTYVGPWLPEPFIDAPAEDELLDDITLPLMLALERLSPLERAAFLLHDVFGADFAEIAETIGRTPTACRQLASRARLAVREAKPRYPVPRKEAMEIAAAFFDASRGGDMQRLRALLSADVVAHSDGGGRKPATPEPVIGIEAVMAVHERLALSFARGTSQLVRYGVIDGLPGFVTIEEDETLQTTALALDAGRITAIYIVRNPDKLRHIGASRH
ncbi:RNA polymerase sigma factor SigJ [Devosia geojensis]|uniref:RNA polymerase sigma factor SigJ n=1 Tax=Devosia geojensis TaxID=443610 RepID=A0A0F5FR97_9HYPH|nr:sigma-70 family RNA polymerase sigma factor [Devosia geojensis]KKB11075.1 RNA polymerase sigma factor SigJ [Devosia geojensis]